MRIPASTRRAHLVRLAVVLLLALGLLPALAPQPARADESTLTVISHICPAGTNMADTLGNLEVACPNGAPFDFTLTTPAGSQPFTTNGGFASFNLLPPGSYTITQAAYDPAVFGPPTAFCRIDDALGNNVVPAFPVSVAPGAASPFDVAVDGYAANCDTFNAEGTPTPPPPTQGEAEVYVSKWECPEGYTDTSYAGLSADCTTEMEGVEFTIRDFADDAMTDDTGGQPARASFNGWKTGGSTITESIPQGYGEPVVYCYAQDSFGTVFPGYELANYPATGGTISIDIPVDPNGDITSFFCDWYNIPGATGYTDDAEVFISKWECPAGYASDDYADLQAECTRELEGIDFTIEHESGESASDDTGGQPARAAFTPWYNGSSTITESAPEGYGTPIVYCYATDDFGDVIPGYELSFYPVEGYTISVMIPTDPDTSGGIVSFFCDWFNVTEDPTYAGIYIHKYGCPQGFGADSDVEELAAGCYTIVRGAEFEVSGPSGYEDTQTLWDVDLAWENLEPGDYTVSETPPQGYRDSKLYCAVGSYESGEFVTYEEVEVEDGGFSVGLEGGQYYECIWYNIPPPPSTGGGPVVNPSGPATLIVVKATCEEGYDPYATQADPTEDCDEPTDGVTFTLRGGRDSSLTKVTGEDDDPGTVTFEGLPAGSYLLQEEYPEDVDSAFVWDCTSSVRGWVYAFAPFAWVGPEGVTKVNVVPGETLTCRWYDVPSPEEENGTGGTVQIAVRDCPGDLVNEATCEPAPAGVAVTLVGSGDAEDAELETDDDGVASGSVEPGGYDLEVDGDACFADSDAFDDDGLLLVDDAPVEVTVFRCDE